MLVEARAVRSDSADGDARTWVMLALPDAAAADRQRRA
jgi:hypothetical protein